MQSITKVILRTAILSKRSQNLKAVVSATSQIRPQVFSAAPRMNFWKKGDPESNEDAESAELLEKIKAKQAKEQKEQAAKTEKTEKTNEQNTKEEKDKKEKEDAEWEKKEEEKDKKREEDLKKNKEKEAEKKLPNTFEELLELGTAEANKKLLSMFKDLKESKTKLDGQYKILSEEKTAYQNQTTQWQEKAKEFKKIVENTLDDMERMRGRLEKEKEQMKIFAITKFAGEILEVNDNIERALLASKELKDQGNNLYDGTVMTQKILDRILERNGVIKLNPAEGEKFDPNYHDALCQVPDPTKESGSVAFVAQTGYKIQERVLRPAKVGVTIKP